MEKKIRDDDEIQSPNKRSKLGDGSHLLIRLGARVGDSRSRSASPDRSDRSCHSAVFEARVDSAASRSTSPTKHREPHPPGNPDARIDGTVSRSSNGSFPEATWISATPPSERHYIIQSRRCDNIKPHVNEHWRANGPVQKCTTCTAKAAGGGACRFEGLRAFAGVPVGKEIKNFDYDIRIHDKPHITTKMTVTDMRRPKKPLPKNFKSSLAGFRGSEQPDFMDWVLRSREDDLQRLAVSDMAPTNHYPHGISEAARRIETVAKSLAKSRDSDLVQDNAEALTCVLSNTNQSAFDILRLIAPTLHRILDQTAPYLIVENAAGSPLPPVIFRSPVSDERVTCDSCGTTCFLGSCVCVLCGREMCVDCWRSWQNGPELFTPRLDRCANRKRHTKKHFYTVNRSGVAEVNWLLRHTSPKTWSLIQEAFPFLSPHQTLGSSQAKERQILPVDLLASFKKFVHNDNSGPLLGKSIGPLIGLPLPETFSYRERPLTNEIHAALLKHSRPLLPNFEVKDLSPEAFPLTDCLFRNIWHLQGDRARGMPIVISGMLSRFNVAWTPAYFTNNYGDEQCWLVNCSTNETLHGGEIVTVREFFQSFETYSFRGVTTSMKLKDWPPHDDFATHFPELFEDFQKALPFPDRMSRGGFANLASHFPTEVLQPDLGPKMYCAYPAPEFFDCFSGEEKGSTRLHLDVTCAINVMVYAVPVPEGRETASPPAAVWDIFEPRDTKTLNEYLRQKYPHMGIDDPVNRQVFYLSSDDLSILNTEKWGYTKSFRILQEPGDAVLIPAGCAHQVANGRGSIKVAVDFIAAERIHVCEDVMTMFRDMAAQYKYPLRDEDAGHSEKGGPTKSRKSNLKNQRRVSAAPTATKISLGVKEDILQLYNCLYFTYFQIRGLDLSMKLGSYGHGSRGVDAIFSHRVPGGHQVTVRGIADVAIGEVAPKRSNAEGDQLSEDGNASKVDSTSS
ncbi:hypothetical protein GP486_001077 [Trichoglossum hirsutum]|uniref:JmjC domain-containing protein n=1 Tax=Trichoglossum hirsutum TaxID=265104 RepID=A0A9P8LHQ7_9PEZI|nr:hypothetical protein GP486_001077 [Trichoglossum hirsutum]